MIKQLLNSVITKYHDLSVSRRSIICLSLQLRQIIDLLATDKSRYFAQPGPIIVNLIFFHPTGASEPKFRPIDNKHNMLGSTFLQARGFLSSRSFFTISISFIQRIFLTAGMNFNVCIKDIKRSVKWRRSPLN